ncbi:MAG: hypothetical protein HY673_06130 [Chloroflexi bacterium]|nr:hypothetical protein [Chloroflexota bacterium]
MLITLVHKEGEEPPTPEKPGQTTWSGGYYGEPDELPGSIVTEQSAGLEVGIWYTIEEFRKRFKVLRNEHKTWTEIFVPVLTPVGEAKVSIQVEQHSASQMLLESVLQFAEQLQKGRRLWIRVE